MLPRSTFGLVRSAVPLSAIKPAAPKRERGARHGADVARVLDPVEHQHHRAAAGPECSSVQSGGSITATTPCGMLGVGQLGERRGHRPGRR